MIAEPPSDAEIAFLRSPATWTEQEMRRVMADDAYWQSNHPMHETSQRAVKEWHDTFYNTRPGQLDATGRAVPPSPARPIPQRETNTNDAISIVLANAAELVADHARQGGVTNATRALQSGLNVLGGQTVPLRKDGILGRKTKTALNAVASTDGMKRVREADALGRFTSETENDRGPVGQGALDWRLERTIGGLFEKPDQTTQGTFKPWKAALQETVNQSILNRPGFPGGCLV